MTQKVSKASVKASLLKIRRLVVAIGLFFVMQMGWGATCYWIGGAKDIYDNPDNKWSTLANWTTAIDGTGTAEKICQAGGQSRGEPAG